MNIAVLSNNMFFNSRAPRNVEGRYRYNRARPQHVGARSDHRKLRALSGRERRFVLNVNHVVSKRRVEPPFNVFTLEKLGSAGMWRKASGRGFNRKLGAGLLTSCSGSSSTRRRIEVKP